jgi:transposase
MKIKKQISNEIKLKAIESYNNGENIEEISSLLGVSERTIFRWIKNLKINNSVDRKRVNAFGRPPKLDKKNSENLLKLLKKPASEFGFETDLWNTTRLKILCKKKLNVDLSKMAIWRFLNKFDQSFKKVQKQYYETDESSQEEWIKTTLKKIKSTVRKHRAILYFEDESSIQLSPVMGKSWGPIGKKIVHKVTGRRGSIAAISAISNDGRLVFNLYEGTKRFNADDIIIFLKQMLDHHPTRHLVIIMDQAPCHKAKKIEIFEQNQKRLHIFYLPTRSPKFNPDEQVWAHLKNHDLKSHMETNLSDLKTLANKKLRKLKDDPDKVMRIFKRCEKFNLYQC